MKVNKISPQHASKDFCVWLAQQKPAPSPKQLFELSKGNFNRLLWLYLHDPKLKVKLP